MVKRDGDVFSPKMRPCTFLEGGLIQVFIYFIFYFLFLISKRIMYFAARNMNAHMEICFALKPVISFDYFSEYVLSSFFFLVFHHFDRHWPYLHVFWSQIIMFMLCIRYHVHFLIIACITFLYLVVVPKDIWITSVFLLLLLLL